MMSNNHKKSGCGFSELLVSYIYGETDAHESAKFEGHLVVCTLCTDELESFSAMHFAIDDWKTREFAALRTPVIEIPETQMSELSTAGNSWTSGLRRFLTFSPSWSLAAAFATILSVALGIVFYSSKSPNGGEVAGTGNTKIPVVIAPATEKSSDPATVDVRNEQTSGENKPPVEQKMPATTATVETKDKRAGRPDVKPRLTQKAELPVVSKNEASKRKNKNAAPRTVLPEEDEDNTLRLAELFEEIETKE